MWDRLLTNCHVATMDPAVDAPFGAIEDGAIGIGGRASSRSGGGSTSPATAPSASRILGGALGDAGPGSTATPTSCSAATAPPSSSSGWRARATRRSPAPAAASCRRCKATRAASEDELFAAALPRARGADGRGRDHARDQVRLRPRPRDRAQDAARRRDASARRAASAVRTTFLGRARLPPEFAGSADGLHRRSRSTR